MIPDNIIKRAREVFASEEKAKAWLNSPVTALGGMSPLEVIKLRGDAGVELVLAELGRIEHGIIS